MGCNGSKAVDTELVIRCRERRDLIKAAADHRYYLAAAHVSYFHSLKDVGDALRRFVDEELIAAASSSSPSSLSSPSLILPSGKKQKPSSGSSSSLHHHDHDGDEKESHLHLSSDSSDDDEHFHLHDSGHNRRHLHIDEEEGHMSPDSPFLHPDLPIGTHAPPYVTMNQEPPPQMGYWDPFYGYNPQMNSQFQPQFQPFYGGNPNSNTYSYYMKKSTPMMKTVIHEAEPATSTAYSNAYWSPPYQNGGDYFGYPPMGPSVGERTKKPSPPAEPPPPPSPKASVWDFLNPFDSIEQGQPSYFSHGGYGYGSNSSSPDLKEVREREGIPDLEEETETEVYMNDEVKKKLNNEFKKKRAVEGPSSSSGGPLHRGEQLHKRVSRRKKHYIEEPMPAKHSQDSSISRGPPSEESGGSTIRLSSVNDECSLSDMTSSIDISEEKASSGSIVSKSQEDSSVKTKGVTFKVDHDGESSKLSNSNNKPALGTRDLREVVAEIKDEFEIASGYGREVALMLEVGKLPYHHSFRRVLLSRILCSNVPSSSSLRTTSAHSVTSDSRTRKLAKSYFGDVSPEINLKPSYLSSTLAQLYEWEKKLYKEVKEEEQLRLVYERQCRKLRMLDERGTESSKIDAVQASIRKLLTKLNVSIKAIDSISSRIHKLRDEELQPQVSELINGLIRMWRSMLNCHQKQFQAIMESKTRALKANTGSHADSTVRATLELELQLLAWCSHFNDWICTQKSYVESLNGWLLRCLLYEPEETPDGPVPFSPGRLGAPPIFVISNDWNQAMEAISETRVAMTMNNFASSLRKLWERQDEEQRQRLRAEYLSKDYKRRLKMLKMENGRRTGHDHQDAMSQKTGASMVPSEKGVSPLDDLKVDLDSFRKKMVEEKGKHEDALKLVHDAASTSLQGGLLPIFKALENFTLEAVKAHEQVRLQNI